VGTAAEQQNVIRTQMETAYMRPQSMSPRWTWSAALAFVLFGVVACERFKLSSPIVPRDPLA